MNMESLWNNKWFLAITSGVLLGFSYSPFPLAFLTIPAFVLLLRVTLLTGSIREMILYTYPTFLIWNAITTYWLLFATVSGGIAAIVANSAIMLIPLAMMRTMYRSNLSAWLKVPLAAAPWVAYEWLHLQWDLSWPWLAIANAYSTATFAVQYIEFTGYLSISFWVLCVAGWAYIALNEKEKATTWFAAATLAAMLPVLLSLILLRTFDDTPDRYLNVVVAQPNFDSYQHLAGYPNPDIPLNGMIALSDSARTADSHLVLWPENAIMGGIFERRPTSRDQTIAFYAQNWGIPVVGGASWYQHYDDKELPRVHRLDNQGRPFNIYNSAIGFNPNGTRLVYNKMKLVPIVERFPFVNQLSRIPFIPVNWPEISGYGRGREMILFEADDVLFPAVICYDSVFPALVRESVTMGAGFVSVITNDGWWGRTSGHVQHYDFARLRAIEMRRAVVRSANNGISGMINADGSPHSRTEYWTRTAFEIQVPIYSHLTFYARTGEWFGWLMLISGILGWGLARLRVLGQYKKQ